MKRAWKKPEGWRYWSAVNNSEVGVWYTTASFLFMLFGGVLAILVAALAPQAVRFFTPDAAVVDLGAQTGGAEGGVGLPRASAQLVVLDGENAVAARVTSAADGTFRVELPPGEYLVHTWFNGHSRKTSATIPASRNAPVRISLGFPEESGTDALLVPISAHKEATP